MITLVNKTWEGMQLVTYIWITLILFKSIAVNTQLGVHKYPPCETIYRIKQCKIDEIIIIGQLYFCHLWQCTVIKYVENITIMYRHNTNESHTQKAIIHYLIN